MHKIVTAAFILFCLFSNFMGQAAASVSIIGFKQENVSNQLELEKQFAAGINREEMIEWHKRLSEKPNHIGSPHNREMADYLAALFKEWGFKVRLEEFRVLFPTPKERLVEMVAPEKYRLKLNEPPVIGDATSEQQDLQLPTYNAYSIDGDVTAPLVYVNYGVPDDYEVLERAGISVKGKIVIARYGGSWRGIKPKVAAEHGALGCIIYSDPRNDGYYQGDTYPKGPWRNENGVQRGSVMDMPLYPGDPLTKNIGATPDAKRIDRKDAETLTKIPVLPISYSDALPLLKNLDGETVPENWRGALPITYHFGGGSPTVRLKLEFNWNLVSIYNVIAELTGSERPNEWIIRGNHRDGWVNGADDPLSGLAALLAEAKSIGQLAKKGWKPKRTIIYAAWDGEEEGLLGSTEWVEQHEQELASKAAVYINTDSNGRGFLGMGGSHTLEKFINEVAKSVRDPQTGFTVFERAKANLVVNGPQANRREFLLRNEIPIAPLGSGSDYTPFLQHVGIASLNLGFGGEDGGGSYHSIYDSVEHFSRFVDPGMFYGAALAEVCGRATLRLANADVLPFEFNNFSDTVARYLDEVIKLTDTLREETRQANRLIDNGYLKAAQDPKKPFVLPQKKEDVPYLNFAPLQNAIVKVAEAAANYRSAAALNNLDQNSIIELDKILIQTERRLTLTSGLPRRDWFKHQIYAPGFYTGYGVKTLPGVREAIEQRNWSEAEAQIKVLAQVLENFATEINLARQKIESKKQ